MLDLKFIRDNVQMAKERPAARGEAPAALDELIQIDVERRGLLVEAELLKQKRNDLSKRVAELKRQGKSIGDALALVYADAPQLVGLDQQLQEKEAVLQKIEEQVPDLLLGIPNLPPESTPVGKSPEDNAEVRRGGPVRRFDFEPKPHWELGETLGILDFERAARIAQSRFAVLKGLGARLERALMGLLRGGHA